MPAHWPAIELENPSLLESALLKTFLRDTPMPKLKLRTLKIVQQYRPLAPALHLLQLYKRWYFYQEKIKAH